MENTKMKITKRQLRRIIKEEKLKLIKESSGISSVAEQRAMTIADEIMDVQMTDDPKRNNEIVLDIVAGLRAAAEEIESMQTKQRLGDEFGGKVSPVTGKPLYTR